MSDKPLCAQCGGPVADGDRAPLPGDLVGLLRFGDVVYHADCLSDDAHIELGERSANELERIIGASLRQATAAHREPNEVRKRLQPRYVTQLHQRRSEPDLPELSDSPSPKEDRD